MKIPSEFCDYIESLMYEVNARRDLCAFMISHGMGESEAFEKYHQEYLRFNAQYMMAKNMVSQMYSEGKPWRIDFEKGELIFLD